MASDKEHGIAKEIGDDCNCESFEVGRGAIINPSTAARIPRENDLERARAPRMIPPRYHFAWSL